MIYGISKWSFNITNLSHSISKNPSSGLPSSGFAIFKSFLLIIISEFSRDSTSLKVSISEFSNCLQFKILSLDIDFSSWIFSKVIWWTWRVKSTSSRFKCWIIASKLLSLIPVTKHKLSDFSLGHLKSRLLKVQFFSNCPKLFQLYKTGQNIINHFPLMLTKKVQFLRQCHFKIYLNCLTEKTLTRVSFVCYIKILKINCFFTRFSDNCF